MASTLPHAFPAFTMRPLTGLLEMAAAGIVGSNDTRPGRVTRLLSTLVKDIAGVATADTMLKSFSAATREWLLQQTAAFFQPGTTWLQSRCTQCGEKFDAAFDVGKMPKVEPNVGFPLIKVKTSQGIVKFDVPNGHHEEQVAAAGLAPVKARQYLAQLCVCNGHDYAFTATDFDEIDVALEKASPDIADCGEVICPSCNAKTYARLEPLSYAFPRENVLLRDVHALASTYGWSENSILSLPSQRRLQYLAMITPVRREARS